MSVSVGAVMPEPKPAMTGEAVATGAMKRRNDTDLIVDRWRSTGRGERDEEILARGAALEFSFVSNVLCNFCRRI